MSSVASYILSLKAGEGAAEHMQLLCQIEEYHSDKLWHQLTESLLVFVRTSFIQRHGLLALYNSFITDFEHKINPLSLVEITLYIIRDITDPTAAVTFMEGIKEKVKSNVEASVLCLIAIGGLQLKMNNLPEVKSVVEEAGSQLDTATGITRVHARYYDLCSNYHKLKADHTSYYHDALHFLGCVELSDLSIEEQSERAFSLGLAALLGKDVYNFGELLGHPVISSLKGGEKVWLVELMYAFNSGNIDRFNSLQPIWEQQPDLFQNKDNLMNKIRLLALMELVFRRHAHDRSVTFADVSNAAKITEDNVEMLVMKALSLKLVKGQIDQVRQIISMNWVQPRVLDHAQVDSLKQRMTDWCGGTSNTIQYVTDQVPDAILAH